MADETTTDTRAPLPDLSNSKPATFSPTTTELDTRSDKSKELHPEEHGQSVSTTGDTPAGDRLLAFEDAELGQDTVRINGQIERGYGSKFKDMPESKQRKHAALTRLVAVERKIDDINASLAAAHNEHDQVEAEIAREDEAIAAEDADARPE